MIISAMAHDVFLSYSSKDKAAADAVCNVLECNRIRVWMAPRDILPGVGWAASIIGAISGARVMVLVFSRHANRSPQIEREVERAINKAIPIIPFRVENVEPSDALEYFISSPHWLDAFAPPFEQHLERLAEAVRQLLDSEFAIKGLARRNGLDVHHASFHNDMDKLVRALRGTSAPPPKPISREDQLRAEGRIKVDAIISDGAPDGWFKPGAGKVEWFKDHECGPEMVVVPAGEFAMGSSPPEIVALKKEYSSDWFDYEGPQRTVKIKTPFAVGRFAVTFDEWDACVADGGCNGYRPSDRGWGRGKRPVINVSWEDATAYAAWLSRKTGKTYRLLSEAEREYVARAGTTMAFWWGDTISTSQANYNGNYTFRGGAKGKYREKTVPVDSYEPNPWGLYNVHGNVWEWVEDVWHDNYKGAPTDGSAWLRGGDARRRVIRGGSWYNYPLDLRSASRDRNPSVDQNDVLGFRLARTLNP